MSDQHAAAPGDGPGGAEAAFDSLGRAAAFLRRRVRGDYEVDDLGLDVELNDTVLAGLLRPVYRHWFRVQVRGLEHVPSSGGALVVSNHAGALPLDALMLQLALLDEHPAHRHLRPLGADLLLRTPFLGDLARRSGTTLACAQDVELLLSRGELVGVWPEGFKGIGKPFRDRYRVQRFGRGGFVTAALRTGTPIVPCAVVGAEEAYPIVGNLPTAARLLGLPYFPVTPTFPWLGPLGLVPLPSRWIVELCPPVLPPEGPQGPDADPQLVRELADQVRETVQATLHRLLAERGSAF